MRVRTRRYADLLERDGEALVLVGDGGGLLRLSAVGTAIVELAANSIELEVLAGALERRFGSPPDSSALQLAEAMVQELASRGLLELGDPQPPGPGPHWRISDDAAFVLSAPDRVVVLNLAEPAAQPKALLGSAAAIWHRLVGTDEDPRPWVPEPALLADLAAAYATDPEAIKPDVTSFLREMATESYLLTTAG